VTNLYVLVASMVNVSCLACAPVILDGLDGTAAFVKSALIANMAVVSMNLLSVLALASTKDRLVTSPCAKKAVTLNMATAKCLNSAGAGQDGLVRTAQSVSPTGTVSTEPVLMAHGSAFVKKDGLDLIAIAQPTQMEIGANGASGAIVQRLAAEARESGPVRVTTQHQLATELIALTMEALAMKLSRAMRTLTVVKQVV